MAISNFIPQIWAAGVNTAFFQNQVVIPTLTTTYSGEARDGNVVKVTGAVTPTIGTYSGSSTAEALSDSTVSLSINQKKFFAFKVDDVDKVQAAGSFDQWTAAAGRGLAEESEKYVIAQMISGGTSQGTMAITTGDNAKTALRKLRTALSAAKVPANGRYCVVNSAMADLILAGLSDAAQAGSDSELRNGLVGRLYGMTIVESALFTETKPQAIAYHEATTAYVSQLDSVEALRDTSSFSDIVRGLHVYGAAVTGGATSVQYITATA
jgi:hypothetical protein